MALGHSKELEVGRHLKYQIDRYLGYRYSDVFLADAGSPHFEASCTFDPPTFSYRYRLRIFERVTNHEFYADMRVDATQLERMPNGRNREEWLLYCAQDMLPLVDTGIFSCWFASRLDLRLAREFTDRVLPIMQRIKLLPFSESRDKIDRGSLCVFYLKNGGEWRETINNIVLDPEAFLANLLMLIP